MLKYAKIALIIEEMIRSNAPLNPRIFATTARAKLAAENSQLLSEKQQMATQIVTLHRGLFGKLKQKLAQRKK